MATRTVTGVIRHGDGTVWAGAAVAFELRGDYTLSAEYPATTVTATADTNGAFSVNLWVNAEGYTQAKYHYSEAGKYVFSFTLPAGDGSPLTIGAIRASTATAPLSPNAVIELINFYGWHFKAAWSSGATYVLNDVVTRAGSSYICTATTSHNSSPPSADWGVVATAGTTSANATSLQGRTLSATAPQDAQVVTWNEGTQQWEPQDSTGGASGAYVPIAQTVALSSPTGVFAVQPETSGVGPFVVGVDNGMFNSTPDWVFRMGYNTGSGASLLNTAEPSFAFVIEQDFHESADFHWLEGYLEYVPQGPGSGVRPLSWGFDRSQTDGADALLRFSMLGNHLTVGRPSDGFTYADYTPSETNFTSPPDFAGTNTLAIQTTNSSASSQLLLQAGDNISAVGLLATGPHSGNFRVGGRDLLRFFGGQGGVGDSQDKVMINTNTGNAALSVAPADNYVDWATVLSHAKVGQTGNVYEARSSGDVVTWAVAPDGKMLTNQAAGSATAGSVVNKMPVYDAAGTLLGYIPIYNS